jgi:hypothetical protein
MAKLYEMELETQIRRLCATMLCSTVFGAIISYKLYLHHHLWWATMVAIIAAQVVTGSYILMSDIKRDLRDRQDSKEHGASTGSI